ncbi:MAG: alpha/beta fold hydrolase [Planctomycetota bacterium]
MSVTSGTGMRARGYGTAGPSVLVLHGGPGAPGYVAPVARGLARSFRVLEPWQRGSGSGPLTVARHVDDLEDLIVSRCEGERPAIVGHSFGAMLALAHAAAHATSAGPLVLIGCGTFDRRARDRLRAIREARMDEGLRRRLERLPLEFPDPDARLRRLGKLMLQIDSFELASLGDRVEVYDARANEETWEDMLRLQEEGVYPAAFAAIDAPVLMLHGAFDPHPGQMIRTSLASYLPQLEYHEWERCGHYPWLEKAVRDEFRVVLHDWLARHMHVVG